MRPWYIGCRLQPGISPDPFGSKSRPLHLGCSGADASCVFAARHINVDLRYAMIADFFHKMYPHTRWNLRIDQTHGPTTSKKPGRASARFDFCGILLLTPAEYSLQPHCPSFLRNANHSDRQLIQSFPHSRECTPPEWMPSSPGYPLVQTDGRERSHFSSALSSFRLPLLYSRYRGSPVKGERFRALAFRCG